MQLDLLGEVAAVPGYSEAATGRAGRTRRMVERAVERGDVHLAFQPVVSACRQGAPVFFEGLVRIRDAAGKARAAGAFITDIEPWEIGRSVDCMALERGFLALRDDPDLTLSINLSARSMEYERWQRTLRDGLAGVESLQGRLILEITESSAMGMPAVVTREMTALRARGLRFALDDFGAGCTSFRYLKTFRFDLFKIDGQFINGISKDGANRAITKAFIDVARHFRMKTVAEMVETEEDATCLSELGIDYLQGYLLGRPAPRLH